MIVRNPLTFLLIYFSCLVQLTLAVEQLHIEYNAKYVLSENNEENQDNYEYRHSNQVRFQKKQQEKGAQKPSSISKNTKKKHLSRADLIQKIKQKSLQKSIKKFDQNYIQHLSTISSSKRFEDILYVKKNIFSNKPKEQMLLQKQIKAVTEKQQDLNRKGSEKEIKESLSSINSDRQFFNKQSNQLIQKKIILLSEIQNTNNCQQYFGIFCIKCSKSFFLNYFDQCTPCQVQCNTCINSSTNCTTCRQGFFLNNSNKCIPEFQQQFLIEKIFAIRGPSRLLDSQHSNHNTTNSTNSTNSTTGTNSTNSTNSTTSTNSTNSTTNATSSNNTSISNNTQITPIRQKQQGLFVQILATLFSVPIIKRARVVRTMGFFLGRIWLYNYDNRQYNTPVNQVFETIVWIQQKKWAIASFNQKIPLKPQMLVKSRQYEKFTNERHFTVDGKSDIFFEGAFQFFIYTIAQTLVIFLILRVVFFLIFNHRLSIHLRKFAFYGYFFQILLQENLDIFSYLSFNQLKMMFSFTFTDKVWIIISVLGFFVIIIYTVAAYFIFQYLYQQNIRHLLQQLKPMLPSLFLFTYHMNITNFLIGCAHSLLHFQYQVLIFGLITIQILAIIVIIYGQAKYRCYRTPFTAYCLAMFHGSFIIFDLLLYVEYLSYSWSDKQQLISLFEDCQAFMIEFMLGLLTLLFLIYLRPECLINYFRKKVDKKKQPTAIATQNEKHESIVIKSKTTNNNKNEIRIPKAKLPNIVIFDDFPKDSDPKMLFPIQIQTKKCKKLKLNINDSMAVKFKKPKK